MESKKPAQLKSKGRAGQGKARQNARAAWRSISYKADNAATIFPLLKNFSWEFVAHFGAPFFCL